MTNSKRKHFEFCKILKRGFVWNQIAKVLAKKISCQLINLVRGTVWKASNWSFRIILSTGDQQQWSGKMGRDGPMLLPSAFPVCSWWQSALFPIPSLSPVSSHLGLPPSTPLANVVFVVPSGSSSANVTSLGQPNDTHYQTSWTVACRCFLPGWVRLAPHIHALCPLSHTQG